MTHFKTCLLFALFLFFCATQAQPTGNKLLEKGWAELVKDNDGEAFRYFWQAHQKAKAENNTADKAEALLYLGICTFGSSLEKGLQYGTQAMGEYKKLEQTDAHKAKIGRSKCLQLVSTIYSRQKKYKQAMQMSKEVVSVLKNEKDTSGTLGLAYSSLGSLYELQKKTDSSEYFFRLALQDFERSKNVAYLPNAYLKLGGKIYLMKALALADSTQNKQAQVSSLVSLGKLSLENGNPIEAEAYFNKAHHIAIALSDKMFEMKTLEALIGLKKQQKDFSNASSLQSRLLEIKDNFYSLEREQIVKSLEVQFEVSEKDRKIALVSKEREVSKLTNYLLGIGILVLAVIFLAGYSFQKRIHRKDKELLKTQEALVDALEKQKVLKEQQFTNDIEHKESQLSAITLQMLQKNELLDEIKSTIEKEEQLSEKALLKMVNKHFTQDSSWQDFDLYFESINKNFYTRLKQSYPDISSNDLKICALIKLNLSIKEMASILNISPDSVKTARYRLRKKLQLNTEDNLTAFILSI